MQETPLKYDKIMEIKITSNSKKEVLTAVEDFISHNLKFSIVTPNPELILRSQTDKKLKKVLNSASLSVPDGFGLKFAIPSLGIIKGRELFIDLVELSVKRNWKVFLLGGIDDEAAVSTKKLQKQYSKLQIKYFKGPMFDKDAKPMTKNDEKLEKEAIDEINSFKPQLLFVAFGNPKQEIWINEHLSELNIGGAMAVGGTLRYIAGLSKLPPDWMSSLGLEWLWRVITEPVRIGRILRAVIIFPLRCFIFKIKN